MTDLLVGKNISHYRIDRILGQGGMGSVYLAFDTRLKRNVALKVMHSHLASQPEFQQRFLQEAQAAAALNHSHITRVYDTDQWQGFLYIVMELIEGGSLRTYQKYLREKGKLLLLTQVFTLITQVSDALDYAHSQGMIHRDVKPDNILLNAVSGRPDVFNSYLTDFGLAKLAEGGVHSITGQVMGTLAYMSPEQCQDEPLDGRSDIYSLGIVLYELIAGKLPFSPRTISEAIKMHTQTAPPPLDQLRPGLPSSLVEIVNRAIEKDPERRFNRASELSQALQALSANDVQQISVTLLDKAPESESVVTYLQSKPIEFQELASVPFTIGKNDVLIIIDPQGVMQSVPLGKPSLSIGREKDNDIVLAHESVSRHHARLEQSPRGDSYVLTDLDSSNGTYLGDAKLIANIGEPWPPEKNVRLGAFRLQWRPGSAQAQQDQDAGIASVMKTAPIIVTANFQQPSIGATASPSGLQANMSFSPPQVEVTPGDHAEIRVEMINQSSIVEHFAIEAQGIPADWVTLPAAATQLMPTIREHVVVSIHPPHLSSVVAGTYRFRLALIAQTQRREVASADGTIQVKPYVDLAADFQPKRLNRQHLTQLTLTNSGNAPLKITANLRDRENALEFTPAHQVITVAPGATQQVPVTIRQRRQSILGGWQTYPFEIAISSEPPAQRSLAGEYVAWPLLPSWILAVAALLILACIGLAGLAWNALNARADATETAVALVQTGVASQTSFALDKAGATATAAKNISVGGTSTRNAVQTVQALGVSTQTAIALQGATSSAAAAVFAQASANAAFQTNSAATQTALSVSAANGSTQTAVSAQILTQVAASQTALAQTQIAANQTSSAQMLATAAAQTHVAGTQTALALDAATQAVQTAVAQTQTAAHAVTVTPTSTPPLIHPIITVIPISSLVVRPNMSLVPILTFVVKTGPTVIIGSGTVAPANFGNLRLNCPANMVALGGGVDPEQVLTMVVTSSAPVFADNNNRLIFQPVGEVPLPIGWQVSVRNNDSTPKTFKAAVMCLGNITGKTIVAHGNAAANNFDAVRVDCPAAYSAISGGIDLEQVLTMVVTSSAPVFTENNNRLIFQPKGTLGVPIGWQASARNNDTASKSFNVAVICVTGISMKIVADGDNAAANSFGAVRVDCPANTTAISGGLDPDQVLTMVLTAAGPVFAQNNNRLIFQPDGPASAPTGWQAAVRNNDTTAKPFNVAAICIGP